MEKMARFRCSASTLLNWGGGGGRGAFISYFILSKIVALLFKEKKKILYGLVKLNTDNCIDLQISNTLNLSTGF